jgi:hypothetical protein
MKKVVRTKFYPTLPGMCFDRIESQTITYYLFGFIPIYYIVVNNKPD